VNPVTAIEQMPGSQCFTRFHRDGSQGFSSSGRLSAYRPAESR